MAGSQIIDASLQPILDGDRLALARLITQVENGTQQGRLALGKLFPATGGAHLIGVTGPPGTGKSSLVNQLAHYYRHPTGGETPRRVGIVAVDPSSPFTGGAILGDRVRMRDLAGDPGIFIRSMASRGSLGGLARATAGVVQALDAAGFELILIETVGAGQAEVDIASLAHTTLVVEAPGMGDDIQAIKAGILEIADILVVNKADRPNADATERALRGMLQLAHPTPHVFRHHGQLERVFPGEEELADEIKPSAGVPMWIPPILRTVATEGTGVLELAQAIARHASHLHETNDWQRRERTRLQAELDALIQESLVSRWRGSVSEEHYHQVLQELVERRLSPWQAVSILLDGGA
jgi:LAO/AO transport system kinase